MKEFERKIKQEVRKYLKENFIFEAGRGRPKKLTLGDSDGEWDPDLDPDELKPGRKNTSADDGSTFEEIAAELGLSVAGAHRANRESMEKSQFLASFLERDPEGYQKMIDTATTDYIKHLKKAGELNAEEVELLKNNSGVVQTLDGFREFLHPYVKRERKK